MYIKLSEQTVESVVEFEGGEEAKPLPGVAELGVCIAEDFVDDVEEFVDVELELVGDVKAVARFAVV